MIKNVIKILVGLLMFITVLIGYIPQLEYLVELTCISNMFGGLLLLTDGILGITKKEVHLNSFYLNITVSIFIVFFICMGSLTGIYKFNLNGAFFFLHVINPIVFVICYMLFVNEQNRKTKAIMNAPIMVVLYFLFDYIRYQLTGEFVYGFIKLNEFSFTSAIIVGVTIYAFICLFSLTFFTLNKFVHKKYRITI